MATVQLAEVLAERLPLVYSAVFVLVATIAVQYLLKKDPLADIPFAGSEYGDEEKRRQAFITDAKNIYLNGYRRFKSQIFRITTSHNPNLIQVPAKYLNELKTLSDETLSFFGAVEDTMAAKYTKLSTRDDTVTHTIKTTLTPSLPKLNPILTEEVARAVREEIGACKDWTEVNVNQKLLRIVAIVSGRIFLGPELCHDERYIDAAINYTVELMNARNAVLAVKPWQRWFRASSLPEVRRLDEREAQFNDIIRPIVASRRQAAQTDPNYVKPNDMLQWVLDAKEKAGSSDGDRLLAKIQLGLSFAAIHTTTMTATNAFYDLAANRHLIPELREECQSVLREYGGVFTSPALQALKKLDSCLKESLRHNPAGFSSFQRKVLRPFTLSNGQKIPAGVTIEVPSYGPSRDAEPFPNPDSYDGLRFYRMREAGETFNGAEGGIVPAATPAESNAHNQFVSVTQRSLTFGYGRHACPGRFFAANEIKMIVARTLLEYDMKMVDGVTERYPNFEFAGVSAPDPTKTLLFKEV